MKAMSLPANSRCSIARSLEVLGQRWSLLIVREAMWGRSRFAEFRSIGVPSDVLATRLVELVDAGVLERRPYREPGERTRDEYVLTPAGRDLVPVLAALVAWGDAHRPTDDTPTAVYTDTGTGRDVRLAFVDDAGATVPTERVRPRRRVPA
jgi:DNA-binding HxlR family transcriptional regulator